jgi:hypothetical protein
MDLDLDSVIWPVLKSRFLYIIKIRQPYTNCLIGTLPQSVNLLISNQNGMMILIYSGGEHNLADPTVCEAQKWQLKQPQTPILFWPPNILATVTDKNFATSLFCL